MFTVSKYVFWWFIFIITNKWISNLQCPVLWIFSNFFFILFSQTHLVWEESFTFLFEAFLIANLSLSWFLTLSRIQQRVVPNSLDSPYSNFSRQLKRGKVIFFRKKSFLDCFTVVFLKKGISENIEYLNVSLYPFIPSWTKGNYL